MKSLILMISAGILLILVSCHQPSNPPNTSNPPNSCTWDKPVLMVEEIACKQAWQAKWELEDASGAIVDVPDSFFVDKSILEKMVGNACGFRVSYGLMEPGKISSMIIMFSRIDEKWRDNFNAGEDSVLYSNVRNQDFLKSGNQITPTYLPKKEARTYVKNWMDFHRICFTNDILGNEECPDTNVELEVNPMGKISNAIVQKAPISQIYSGQDIFTFADSLKLKFDGLIFVCSLFPDKDIPHPDSLLPMTDTFRYDLIIKGFGLPEDLVNEEISLFPFMAVKNSLDTDEEACCENLSCPCPWCCIEGEIFGIKEGE